jgi:hypothetical protein
VTTGDEDLLTFTNTDALEYADRLGGSDPEDSRALLREHGDAYRQHLVIAKLLEEQADHLEDPSADRGYGKIYLRGYKVALRHTITDLRNGDFLPGGHRFERRLG